MSAQPATVLRELLNPFCSVPDSESGTAEQSCPSAPARPRVRRRNSFHQTGFRSRKTIDTNERRRQLQPCLFLIRCANYGSSALCRSGDNELWFLSEAKNAPAAEAAQALKPPGLKVNVVSWFGLAVRR